MRFPKSVVVILVGTALFTLAVSNFSEISDGKICGKSEETGYYECPHYDVVPFIFIKVGKTFEHYIGLITFFIALFTLLLVWDGRKKEQRELRAYVGIVYPEVRIDGDRFIAWFDYRNTGQTPAHAVELRVSAEIHARAPNWRQPGTSEDEGKGGILLPEVTWQKYCVLKDTLTNSLLEELQTHKKRIWVWGTISYVDIFDQQCVLQFRFWSGKDIRYQRPAIASSVSPGPFLPLISDLDHTKAAYGKD